MRLSFARVIGGLRRTRPRWNPTALAEVAEQSRDPFQVLIACILSLRVPVRRIQRAIYPVGFYRTKARVVHQISRELLDRFESRVPADLEALLNLPGVGRKTANLVVTMGFGKPGICVDTHVHRISNRLGWVRTKAPDETEMALRARLPRRYWIELNDLLVSFGQNVCTPLSPRCSICPVRALCRRVGVTTSR
jgi:endonuclease III